MTKLIPLMFLAVLPCLAQSAAARALPNVNPQKIDNWQRMKDCAVQAEHFTERNGYAVGGPGHHTLLSLEWKVSGFQNHYSPKYERRFLVIYYHATPTGRDLFLRYRDLRDAFENRVLAGAASVISGNANDYCAIDKEQATCDAAQKYIEERLKN